MPDPIEKRSVLLYYIKTLCAGVPVVVRIGEKIHAPLLSPLVGPPRPLATGLTLWLHHVPHVPQGQAPLLWPPRDSRTPPDVCPPCGPRRTHWPWSTA